MFGFKDRENELDFMNQVDFVSRLDPELDLRNINFATGENKYLNERYDGIEEDYDCR